MPRLSKQRLPLEVAIMSRVSTVLLSVHRGLKLQARSLHASASRLQNWDYFARGPSYWHEQFPVAKGQRQSPIDIVTANAKVDKALTDNPLKIHYGNCCLGVSNTGHSFQVAIDGTETELNGGPLDGTYKLAQFHAHWGPYRKEFGSEHTVDGSTYPAELHLVHWNTKYNDISEAVDKPDGLAVIGVFFKRGREHAGFKPISDLIAKIPHKGDNVEVCCNYDPSWILPARRDYWTYLGSLTTPPLHESVTWIVMKNPVEVSAEQLAYMRMMLWETPDGEDQMFNNYRPPQPLQGRVVRST
ncbi:CA7 [Branchiostoma lanceolatum]|uniref:Carbonic anhydrase n=1 Tax=Branchiostoma lanceolatum TaxID=7740 RepID=A0A8K0A761_BRALA|nr:CA7 [Branchiostoma lanceolatum]